MPSPCPPREEKYPPPSPLASLPALHRLFLGLRQSHFLFGCRALETSSVPGTALGTGVPRRGRMAPQEPQHPGKTAGQSELRAGTEQKESVSGL